MTDLEETYYDYDEERNEEPHVFEQIGDSLYGYNIPYIVDKEKYKEFFQLKPDYFTNVLGIDLEKNSKSNVMSFFISSYFDGWYIHFHMYLDNLDEEMHNTFNPTIVNGEGKDVVFQTKEETEKFLTELLDSIVVNVSNKHCMDIIIDTQKEIARLKTNIELIKKWYNKINVKKLNS